MSEKLGPVRAAGFVLAVALIGGLVWAVQGTGVLSTSLVGPQGNGAIVSVERGRDKLPGVDNVDLVAISPRTNRALRITSTPDADLSPAWSPDGRRVAFERTTSTQRGGRVELRTGVLVMNSDGSGLNQIRRCEQTCDVRYLAWSPDDRHLAWVREVDLAPQPQTRQPASVVEIVDVESGAVTSVCDDCEQFVDRLSWSPDGTRLAFSNSGTGYIGIGGPIAGSIWTARPDGSGLIRLTEGRRCYDLHHPCFNDSRQEWSPDGTEIVFLRTPTGLRAQENPELVVTSADGGEERHISICAGVRYCNPSPPEWSPDGSAIVTAVGYEPRRIELVDPNTGALRFVRSRGRACQEANEPSWSPDGELIAFPGGPGRIPNVCAVPPSGGPSRVLIPALEGYTLVFGTGFTWLPAGAIDMSEATSPLASTRIPLAGVPEGTLVFASENGGTDEPEGSEIWAISEGEQAPHQVTNGGRGSIGPTASNVSPDGTRVAFVTGVRASIWTIGIDGSRLRQLTQGPPQESTPAWSPDGRRIAFTVSGTPKWTGGVYVMDADGSHSHLVAEGNAFDPAWRPDGSAITYALNTPDGELHLRTVDLATRRVHAQAGGLAGSQDHPAWSPDGSELAFSWSSYPSSGIYLVDADGGDLRRVIGGQFGESGISWSPDGRWLAFSGVDERVGPQIFVARPDGAGLRRVTDMKGFVGDSNVFSNTGHPSWTV